MTFFQYFSGLYLTDYTVQTFFLFFRYFLKGGVEAFIYQSKKGGKSIVFIIKRNAYYKKSLGYNLILFPLVLGIYMIGIKN